MPYSNPRDAAVLVEDTFGPPARVDRRRSKSEEQRLSSTFAFRLTDWEKSWVLHFGGGDFLRKAINREIEQVRAQHLEHKMMRARMSSAASAPAGAPGGADSSAAPRPPRRSMSITDDE